jgi:predicted 3-demethylubiquinone-9 3-methyltransferase (glyoxalase superfamily)
VNRARHARRRLRRRRGPTQHGGRFRGERARISAAPTRGSISYPFDLEDEKNALTPFLWFDGNADEVVEYYLSIFPNSKKTGRSTYSAEGPGGAVSTMVVAFELNGKAFMAVNGGPQLSFMPALSFAVSCTSQQEVDYYWDRLLRGGLAMQGGWLTDRFGVSWQIVPSRLGELIRGEGRAANQVIEAMLKMNKLDIEELEAAASS